MKLYENLYVSTLAPDTPVTAVADIMGSSRRHNEASHVTGLMVFDGTRFAQLLEGARDVVFELIERIRADARHADVETLHFARVAERRFNRFTTGFVPTEHEPTLAGLKGLSGDAAIQRLLTLIPALKLT